MPAKMKVVCPKCKVKLKFDPDIITSGIVKFKCPNCASVLSIRKPGSQMEKSSSPPASQPDPTVETNIENHEDDFMDLANKFDIEMGFGEDSHAEEVEEVGQRAGSVGENQEKFVETPDEEEAGDIGARNYKRVRFKKKVLVDKQIMVEALDISENGLFLHTGRSFEDGSIVEVGIPTQPGNFALVVQAMVKHNHRGIGMGLQFVDVDEKQKMQLNKLINELEDEATNELEGRMKILLVGGTDTARNINKSKLVLDGFYVLQATKAEEVFHILDNEPPDAMVLEWQETAFNCKGVLARIRENSLYDAIIRVVLSPLTDATVQQEILDAGAHRCMAKMDTNPAKLSLIIKQMIDERDGGIVSD